MFRNCFFEYADISSAIYNLKLYYTSNSIDNLNSGGEFDVVTESLPKSAEQLLYGIKYSDKPIEFDIEIINPDNIIPFDQVIEIKNWLFGQDGWKIFRTLDERQDYYLKCLLIPQEDIVDGLGYRGFKCKLRNISPFWYGKEKSIVVSREELIKNQQFALKEPNSDKGVYWSPFMVDVDITEVANCNYIIPNISFQLTDKTYWQSSEDYDFAIARTNYKDIGDIVDSYSPVYIGVESAFAFPLTEFNSKDEGHISTRFLEVQNVTTQNADISAQIPANKSIFHFYTGRNICYLNCSDKIEYLKFTYTPAYRIGAF